MEAKTIEVRDRVTFIPALAVRLEPTREADRYLLARAGYGTDPASQGEYVLLTRLGGGTRAEYDPHAWDDRTMQVAHRCLVEHWDEVDSGDVVDVQFLLGETAEPVASERATSTTDGLLRILRGLTGGDGGDGDVR